MQGRWGSCLVVSTAFPASCLSPPTGTSSFWTKRPGTITHTSMVSSDSSSHSWTATDTGEEMLVCLSLVLALPPSVIHSCALLQVSGRAAKAVHKKRSRASLELHPSKDTGLYLSSRAFACLNYR